MPPPTTPTSPRRTWRNTMRSTDRNVPRTPTGTDAAILSLAEVLRALGLDHAASLLDGASQKAISRGETPTALLDHLMREQLRVTLEERAQAAVHRSAIFPLTTMETYDFAYPKSIDRELVDRFGIGEDGERA